MIGSFVESLRLRTNERKRTSCPNCGGRNTFSAFNTGDALVWHCFKASCGIKGAMPLTKSVEAMSAMLKKHDKSEETSTIYIAPPHFISVRNEKEAMQYVEKNGCLNAYIDRRAHILFDHRSRRVVFLCYWKGNCVDAVGRRLSTDKEAGPKWMRYGSSGIPYIVASKVPSTDIVVVEDAASACAASEHINAMALMGTNLSKEALYCLRDYDKVYVSLDKDASRKGLDMVQRIATYVPAFFRPLEEDLKYLTPEEIKTVLRLS